MDEGPLPVRFVLRILFITGLACLVTSGAVIVVGLVVGL